MLQELNRCFCGHSEDQHRRQPSLPPRQCSSGRPFQTVCPVFSSKEPVVTMLPRRLTRSEVTLYVIAAEPSTLSTDVFLRSPRSLQPRFLPFPKPSYQHLPPPPPGLNLLSWGYPTGACRAQRKCLKLTRTAWTPQQEQGVLDLA